MAQAPYLTIPGGKPHEIYHVKATCEALTQDLALAQRIDPNARPANTSRNWAQSRGVVCVLCLPELAETLHARERAKDCVVSTDTGNQLGELLHWRKDENGKWWGLVVYGPDNALICKAIPETRLDALTGPVDEAPPATPSTVNRTSEPTSDSDNDVTTESSPTRKPISREIVVANSGEIAVTVEPEGLLVYGGGELTKSYLELLTALTRDAIDVADIDRKDLAAVLAQGAAVANIAAQRGHFVRLSPDSLKLLQAHGAVPGTGGYNRMFVQGSGGKIAGQLQWKKVPLGPGQAAAIQMFAMQMALKSAVTAVEAAVAQVDAKVNQILNLIHADRVGDVVGIHRTLKSTVDAFEESGRLLTADWDTVAHLGPNLETVIARLHAHLTSTTDTLDAADPISTRAKNLRNAVRDKSFGDSLSLLVVAQDALYLWQTLKIERVRTAEPDGLEHTISAARKRLAEHAKLDVELYSHAIGKLEAVREIKPLEIARTSAVRALRADTAIMREQLDTFAEARRGQLIAWSSRKDPRVRDAIAEIGSRVVTGVRKPAAAIANRVHLPTHTPNSKTKMKADRTPKKGARP